MIENQKQSDISCQTNSVICKTSSVTLSNTPNDRRKYLKEYYLKNKAKAQAYQRDYHIKYKKKLSGVNMNAIKGKNVVQDVFNLRDLMQASPDRAASMVNQIIKGERIFSLNI